jgi:hypothetical protein
MCCVLLSTKIETLADAGSVTVVGAQSEKKAQISPQTDTLRFANGGISIILSSRRRGQDRARPRGRPKFYRC